MLEVCAVCFCFGVAFGVLGCAAQIRATYREGVHDGYGFARCGNNGYEFEIAGQYLRKHCHERWPELRTEPKRSKAYRPYVEHWESN